MTLSATAGRRLIGDARRTLPQRQGGAAVQLAPAAARRRPVPRRRAGRRSAAGALRARHLADVRPMLLLGLTLFYLV